MMWFYNLLFIKQSKSYFSPHKCATENQKIRQAIVKHIQFEKYIVC